MNDKTSDKKYKVTLTENQLALVGTAVEGMMNDLISRQAAKEAEEQIILSSCSVPGMFGSPVNSRIH